ncbi:hypothetical protein, partial [Kitasatospora sp. NPDC001225]
FGFFYWNSASYRLFKARTAVRRAETDLDASREPSRAALVPGLFGRRMAGWSHQSPRAGGSSRHPALMARASDWARLPRIAIWYSIARVSH